jgi:hypothetical protein
MALESFGYPDLQGPGELQISASEWPRRVSDTRICKTPESSGYLDSEGPGGLFSPLSGDSPRWHNAGEIRVMWRVKSLAWLGQLIYLFSIARVWRDHVGVTMLVA